MGKRLIVAEKKSVGQEIAKALNCREKIDGARKGENDIVTWARGHLVELCNPEELDDKDCKDKGIIWTFAPNGSRSTKHKPGWYCR